MASVHKTSKGKWEVRWREGERNRSMTFPTKLDAEEKRVSIERQGYGPRSADEVPTLDEFYEVRWRGKRPISPTTQRGYDELWATHISPFLGYRKVSHLNPPMLADWQHRRVEEKAGPTALAKAQTLLGQVLALAVLPWQYLDSNPVAALPKPVRKHKDPRWLTAGDVEAIRNWYIERGDHGSATLVSVLAYVGIRPQDALALTWSDLGEKLSVTKKNVDGVIESGSKVGKGIYERSVFVPAMVQADLRGWRDKTTSESELIFPNRAGQPWTKGQFNNWRARRQSAKGSTRKAKCFKLAAEEVGLGWDLTPYALRHTAATLFVAAGRTHTWIANQLGHSPAVSLRTYQHLYAADHDGVRSEDDFIREARGYAPIRSEIVRSDG